MTPDLILFKTPFKAKLFDSEPPELITGVYKYNDTYLVKHDYGWTDIRFVPGKVVEEIKTRLKEKQ